MHGRAVPHHLQNLCSNKCFFHLDFLHYSKMVSNSLEGGCLRCWSDQVDRRIPLIYPQSEGKGVLSHPPTLVSRSDVSGIECWKGLRLHPGSEPVCVWLVTSAAGEERLEAVLYYRFNTYAHLNGLCNKQILLSRLALILFSFFQCFSGVYMRHSCFYTVE